MEVVLFPNPYRPGIGVRPRREAQRPLPPQHARHCPVLEAGSTAGFLVHPPLAEKETFQIGYEGEGRYQFVYSVNTKGKKWEPWNFQTPQGWDTVYTPVFNMIERPIAPMLVIRVETDWYVHDSEFRYVLQPGETISASHSMPIGQVIFVPREEITFRDGTEEEIAARHQSAQAFYDEKATMKVKTPYGLEYSPHYQSTSRQKKVTTKPRAGDAAGDPTA